MSKIKILIAIADAKLASALQADLRDCGYEAATAGPSLRAITTACRGFHPDLLIAGAGLRGVRHGMAGCGGRRIPVLLAGARKPRGTVLADHLAARLLDYPCPKRVLVMAVEQALPGSSAELYQTHFENVSDIVFTLDRNLTLVSVSPSIKNILGYEPSELVGKRLGLGRFVPASRGRELRVKFRRLLRGQDTGTLIVETRTKGGAIRTLEIKTSGLVPGADGPWVTGTARDITDWKNLAASLHDSEQRYRLLTETSPDMIFVVGPDGIVEYINGVAARAIGKPYDKVIGRRIGELFSKPTSQRQTANIRKVISTGKPISLENQSVMRGKTLWLDTWLVPVRDQRGAVTSVMGISRDITARKRAEGALREREAQLRFLGENMPGVLVYQMDVGANGKMRRFTYISGSVERLHEASAAAVIKDPGLIYRQMSPEHLRLLAAKERAAIRAAVPFNAEAMVTLPSGDVRWRQFISIPQPRPHQRIWDGIEIDITEGKRAEQALRDSEVKYRAHFDQASDGIMFMSADGSRVSVNQSFARMHGYRSPAEMARVRLRDLDTPETAKLAPERLRRMLAGEALDFEVEHFRKDGSIFPLNVSCSVIRIGEQSYFLGFHRDITARKRAEQALQQSERQYRSTIDSMGDAINVVDRRLKIVLANARFERWCRDLRLRPPFAGRGIFRVCPFLSRQVRDQYLQVFRTGRPLLTEETNRVAARAIVTETRKIPIVEHGRVVRVITVVRDITERKRIEQALQESEERFKSIFEFAADGMLLADLDGKRFVLGNQRICDMLGYTQDELRQLSVDDIHPLESIPKVIRFFRRQARKELMLAPDLPVLRKDGSVFYADINSFPVTIGGRKHLLGIFRDISERKRAEEDLRASEEKYRGLVEATDTGFVIIDQAGRVLDANGEYLRLSGHSALPQIRGRPVTDWTAPHDLKRNRAEVAKCTRRGWVRALEIDYVHRDGTIVPIEINATVIRTASGPQIVTLCRDITARKRAEDALRESEQRFRKVFEEGPNAMAMVDGSLHFLRVNHAFSRFLGYSADEMKKLTVRDITHPEHIKQDLGNTRRLLRGEIPVYRTEKRYITKSGTVVWGALQASVVRDAQGKILYALVMIDNITDRKRAEQALRESETRYRLLVKHAPAGIFEFDYRAGKIVTVNDVMCEYTGYTRNEFLKMNPLDLLDGESKALHQKRLAMARSGGDLPENVEYKILCKDGRIIWGNFLSSYYLEDNRPIRATTVVYNITERKRAEMALRESEQINRAISGLTTDYSFIVDVNRRGAMVLRWASENLGRITGRSIAEAATPALWRRIIHPADLAAFSAFVRRTIAGGSAADLECRALTKAGAERWVQVFVQPVRGEAGRVASVIGAVKDITERKRTEQALRASEQNYRTIFNGVNEGIYRSTPDGRPLLNNPALVRMLGFNSEAELLKRDIAAEGYLDPAVRQEFKRQMERAGVVRDFVNTWRKKDGTPLIVRENAHAVRDASGRIQYYEGTVEDITERWRAEQALRDSEERFRSFIEQAAEGIVILDEQGRIVEWNQAQRRIYGPTRDQAIGRYFWDLQHQLTPRSKRAPGQQQYYRRLVQRALRTGRSPIFEKPAIVRVAGPGGVERQTEQRAFPIRTERGFRIGAVTLDVTEQRRLEQQVLEVGDQVQRQIGHDLHDGVSQLLTVVALRMKALQQRLAARRAAESGEAATVAEMIRRTMTEVIGLSRGLSPISLERGGIVLALRELVQNTAAIGVPCRARIDESAQVADLAVATHLYRIAQEAVHNAVKHAHADHIDLTLRRDHNRLLLEIADDGRGLLPAGTPSAGMGLSLMRYRAGMIGATLELERNNAGGTTVRCRFGNTKPRNSKDAR